MTVFSDAIFKRLFFFFKSENTVAATVLEHYFPAIEKLSLFELSSVTLLEFITVSDCNAITDHILLLARVLFGFLFFLVS